MSMDQTSCPAERDQSETAIRQGPDVSASLERLEAGPGKLAAVDSMTASEAVDTAGLGSMVGPGHKVVESGRRDVAAAAAAVDDDAAVDAAADDVAAAAAGWVDSVPKVWAVLLPPAVLAEVQAAEAGQWAWLDGTENESAAGSSSEVWSYQCQEPSASDNSDTAILGPQ